MKKGMSLGIMRGVWRHIALSLVWLILLLCASFWEPGRKSDEQRHSIIIIIILLLLLLLLLVVVVVVVVVIRLRIDDISGECQSTTTRCRGRQPCENVFAGRRPLSEPETIAVANFIHGRRTDIKMYLTLHSYSQLWLTPWGYTADEPNDNDDMVRNDAPLVDVHNLFIA